MQEKYLIRTDLALEAADTGDNKLPEGVFVQEETQHEILITTVKIESLEASQRLGRPVGDYITLEGDFQQGHQLISLLTKKLSSLLPQGAILVVGLGNTAITPDRIGPDSAKAVIATRHLIKGDLPSYFKQLREVCVITPGVMGQTGLESGEIVKSVCQSNSFCAVVAIDALAARSATRLGRTIQLSNTGIAPGAGVLNSRYELSEQTLGIPVISIGIPTVVDAQTLLHCFAPSLKIEKPVETMMVSPKNIDSIAKQGASIISTALNCALQPTLSLEDVTQLMA